MALERKPKIRAKELEDLLVMDLTVGGDVLNNEYFYVLSKDLSQKDMDDVRERAATRINDFYKGLQAEGHIKELPEIDGDLDSWFRPFTRLSGELEFALGELKDVDEDKLTSVVLSFARREDFAPYLQEELPKYIMLLCWQRQLDYTKLPGPMKTEECERHYIEHYPEYVEKMEWPLFNKAYNKGKRTKMTLSEAPNIDNGYIGGEITWSRYLPLAAPNSFGVVLSSPNITGQVKGIGFIDYKDCTNTYVVLEYGAGKQRAVGFYDLDKNQRKAVLYRVNYLTKDKKAAEKKDVKKTVNRSI